MKQLTTLITICWLLPTLQIQAQPTKKPVIQSVGISASTSILDYSVRGQLEPYVSIGNKKKQIVLAPTVLMASNIGYKAPQNPRLTGGRIGYRYWPVTVDQKWAFNISVDLRAQRLKDLWNGNSFNEQLAQYEEHTVKTVELLIENHVGYGLVFKINDSFSLSQGVGIGWYLSNLDARAPMVNRHMSDLVDYRGYDDMGFIWNVRFEVSYKF